MTWFKSISFLFVAVFAASANAAPATTAVKKEPVQIKLEQFKVIVENGKETLAPIQSVQPGEVIEYRATYKNVSTGAVKNLVANSIPASQSSIKLLAFSSSLAPFLRFLKSHKSPAIILISGLKSLTNA
mgnify:CR=1 FL=1